MIRILQRYVGSLVVCLALYLVIAGNVEQASSSPTLGSWSAVEDWPVLPIHATVTSRGDLLTFGADAPPATATGYGDKRYDTWEPNTGSHVTVFQDSHDYFCSLTALIPETEEIMIAGGDDFVLASTGTTLASTYDVATALVTSATPMATPRWYPSGITLANGELLVQGGLIAGATHALTPEIYNRNSGWRSLSGATSNTVYGWSDGEDRWWYPRAWVDPAGTVFGIAQSLMYTLDPTGSGSLTIHGQMPVGYRGGATSTAVMFAPGKILQVGGGAQGNVGGTTALKSAAVIDITGGTPVVTPVADMTYRRHWANATVLPNGQVLVNGGSAENNKLSGLAFPSEIWDPVSQTWTVVASESEERLYHSSSVLLPDGRVFSGGGGLPGPVTNLNAQFFSPPYLFNSNGSPATRPALVWAPPSLAYGHQFNAQVANGNSISRVTLVKTGATTHSFNSDQRFVELGYTQSGQNLAIDAPSGPTSATPGYYLLSVIDNSGVVSHSEIVSLFNSTTGSQVETPPGDVVPPTVTITSPSSGSIEPGPAVVLNGTASDNQALDQVRLFVEDHTPGRPVTYWNGSTWSPARTWFVGSTSAGSFSESLSLPPGEYRFRAQALDTSGNAATTSNTFLTVGKVFLDTPTALGSLSGASENFTWHAGTGVSIDDYRLTVGSSQGSANLFDSGSLGAVTATTASGLPNDGTTVWARLSYLPTGGSWEYFDTRFTAAGDPVAISTPVPGSTLTGSVETFSWDASIGINEYWVYAGPTKGSAAYFDSGSVGTDVSVTIPGLPTDGSTIWVRLWYVASSGGGWQTIDAEYAAPLINSQVSIVSPVAGATLTGTSQAFTWTSGADEYQLQAGPTQGTNTYYDSGNIGNTLTATATGLPTDGSTIWIRLRHRQTNGTWQTTDQSYTAHTTNNNAVQITTPTPGSTLTNTTQTFTWTGPTDQYWVYAGPTQGTNTYYNSGNIGNAHNTTITGLPTDGSTIWIRLWYLDGGNWSHIDATYTTTTSSNSIVSPVAGATLTGTSQAFTWTSGADEYQLQAGPTQGTNTYYDSGNIGNTLTATATGLPTDGSTIWIRLRHRQTNGTWQTTDQSYTAHTTNNNAVQITTPTPGSTLTNTTQTFTWTGPTDQYWVYAGPTQGTNTYYNSGNIGNDHNTTITGLPTDGSTIWIRLWYLDGGNWSHIDATYTTTTSSNSIVSPVAGATLTGTSQAFTWTSGADEYQLQAGPTQGTNTYYDSGNIGNTLTATATGLPTDGSTIWIRLRHRQTNGTWQTTDQSYTAHTTNNNAVQITTPTPGSTLTNTTQTFTWTGPTDQYWVYAGPTQGTNTYYNSGNIGNDHNTTITGLPTDGSTIWIRLWYLDGGNWSHIDATYTTTTSSNADQSLAALVLDNVEEKPKPSLLDSFPTKPVD